MPLLQSFDREHAGSFSAQGSQHSNPPLYSDGNLDTPNQSDPNEFLHTIGIILLLIAIL